MQGTWVGVNISKLDYHWASENFTFRKWKAVEGPIKDAYNVGKLLAFILKHDR